jgi:hypothetical protein
MNMLALTREVPSFPSVSIPSRHGGLPVEVALISQLGIGSGDAMIAGAMARQRGHADFIDELDEPSARLGGVDLARGDATSLYSFAVGAGGHPFHRHAGHRMFTAISGSAGAQLRFSTASAAQVEEDPAEFLRGLQQVNIPPDSLFTVRFGGETWHQFVPLHRDSPHPALFALSCHSNELGGELSPELRERVAANDASIPSLTEVLPASLLDVLARTDSRELPTVALSLHESPTSMQARLCAWTRDKVGRARAALVRARLRIGRVGGFLADNGGGRSVQAIHSPAPDSLLRTQLMEDTNFEDSFQLDLPAGEVGTHSAHALLSAVLDGFLENRPLGVSRLMAFRNVLVKPLGLRTSPLGCPVSSLLSERCEARFDARFPVLAQRGTREDRVAEVILGADDKHLRFRSCVGVRLGADGGAAITLGTRVATRNGFGWLYMVLIDRVHKSYVSPVMLRLAVDHAVRSLHAGR